jgi:crotonobetainyl-CoA:carnitine CoA-transferase CaiB-like acyl-CoA transferase
MTTQSKKKLSLPLEGVTVVDLSHALAGPLCTNLLADYGAKVIKVEPPSGDIARYWGVTLPGGETSYFVGLHRTKRGIVLDLKHPDGKELFFRLLEHADVVIENYRVGALERLGLHYDAARERNPGIIYCSISGFGQEGPYRDRAALDLILQAESGMISVTGEPGTTGARCGVSIADLAAGSYAAYAILLALRVKDQSGEGQFIDVSMLEGQISLLSTALSGYFASGVVPHPMGTSYTVVVPYQTFHTRTRDLAIAIAGEKIWQQFCPTIGCPELLEDPRYETTHLRVQNRDTLVPKLQEIFLTRTYHEWEELLLARDIPVGAINDLAQVVEHPQVKARGVFQEVHHPTAGTIRCAGSPVRLSKTPAIRPMPSPRLGEHTREVLGEMLGLDPTQIQALAKAGAFGNSSPEA